MARIGRERDDRAARRGYAAEASTFRVRRRPALASDAPRSMTTSRTLPRKRQPCQPHQATDPRTKPRAPTRSRRRATTQHAGPGLEWRFSSVDWWRVDPWSRSCLAKLLRHWHRSVRSQQATLDLPAAQPSIPRDWGCSVSHALQQELVLILVLVVLLLLFGGGGYYMGPGVGYYGGGGISLLLLIVILYLLFRGDRTRV